MHFAVCILIKFVQFETYGPTSLICKTAFLTDEPISPVKRFLAAAEKLVRLEAIYIDVFCLRSRRLGQPFLIERGSVVKHTGVPLSCVDAQFIPSEQFPLTLRS